MSPASESPIFSRSHDLLSWLVPATRKFPRDQRFTMAQRLVDQAFALDDALVAAALDKEHQARHLIYADVALTRLRRSLLLAHQLELITERQWGHVSSIAAEVGRLLGGWKKVAK